MTKLINLICLFFALSVYHGFSQTIPAIPRKVPPQGLDIEQAKLNPYLQKLENVKKSAANFQDHPLYPDIHVFIKAIDLLIENGEFYKKNKLGDITKMLELAKARIAQIKQGKTPWIIQKGAFVRGFKSNIDQSTQPYGLEIPEGLNLNQKVPLIVWLHGRGDKVTDYYFIQRRIDKPGKFNFPNAITLHPFGRQCMGYKHVGEVDVFEAIEHVASQYNIDRDRIALMGFSMGGAGTYHLGAHYADRFCVVHTGAGFVETAKYNKLTPENYPPAIEQTLWQMYDVPNYTRNFYNLPIMAYCGDQDSKIPWVSLMQESFKAHGQHLPVIVGKDIGHKYTPESITEISKFVSDAIKRGRNSYPKEIRLQTPTLKYSKNHWVEATGLVEHWKESRIDAQVVDKQQITCQTQNISSFKLTTAWPSKQFEQGDKITIDGKTLLVNSKSNTLKFYKNKGNWTFGEEQHDLFKKSQQQGPMDDAYMSSFIVVTPDQSDGSQIKHWIDFELNHLRKRWKELYRATLPECKASELTQEHIDTHNLILWGSPKSNPWIFKTISQLPLEWNQNKLEFAGQTYSSEHHIPALIYPNPLNQNKTYILYNSAPTFREGHDRTNSLQNPKLGDWAVIDIRKNPDAYDAGKIKATDFFDEFWQVK